MTKLTPSLDHRTAVALHRETVVTPDGVISLGDRISDQVKKVIFDEMKLLGMSQHHIDNLAGQFSTGKAGITCKDGTFHVKVDLGIDNYPKTREDALPEYVAHEHIRFAAFRAFSNNPISETHPDITVRFESAMRRLNKDIPINGIKSFIKNNAPKSEGEYRNRQLQNAAALYSGDENQGALYLQKMGHPRNGL